MKYLIFTGVIILLCLLSFLRYKKTHSTHDAFLLLPFPAVQILLLYGTVELLHNSKNGNYTVFLSVCCVLCIIADIALYRAVYLTDNNSALRARNRQLEEILKMQENHYKNLQNNQNDIDEIKSDISEEIQKIKSLLESNERVELLGALDALKESQKTQVGDGGVIASFTEHHRQKMLSKGILLKSNIRLPKTRHISDVDIICAVGNLLDNAEEACERQNDPVVELCIEKMGQYICIKTKNPIPDNIHEKKHRRIAALDRGMGLSILEELAHRMDGEMEVTRDDGQFSVTLFLKEGITDDQHSTV